MSDDENAPKPGDRLARIFPDHPLQDQELEFEFEGFARTLAELAWNPENSTPFTVVVRGGWGRGKTTLLRRTQWMLENPADIPGGLAAPEGVRTVRTLWFNAWKYPDDDTVLAGLLGAALDDLRKGPQLDQLKHLVGSYGKGALRHLLALAAPARVRDVILEGVEDEYQEVHERRAFHDSFRELFGQVSRLLFDVKVAARDTKGLSEDQLWSPEKQRQEVLAIFLDDLDRCRRSRVVEVLEAINLFLDLPGVCFFLGIDWERLVDVLPETVQGQGDEFLEKIVQVAFDLPGVSAPDVEGYVGGLLDGTNLAAVLGGDGDAASEDVRVLARALETRHPRHVKRFLNDLSMSLAVLRNTGKLGEDEEKQLPEAAVVAWHLLSEILPTDRWRQVRALPANVMAFLRETERWEKDEAAADGGEEREVPEEWARLRASGLPERHLRTLRELSDRQRHMLVYLATPPAVEVERERRTSKKGRHDLFDLGSQAWVEIPGGTFHMGAQTEDPEAPGYDWEARDNESPVRRVTVGPFRLARHPVTNSEYAVFVEDTGAEPPRHWEDGRIPEGKEEHPVVLVSWTAAQAFCQWISRRVFRDENRAPIRLPTEAEWEFAARGEEGRKYPWGEAPKPNAQLANFGIIVGDTTPVGSYPKGKTPEGVLDLAGNVWEWCGDWFGDYSPETEQDPKGPPSGATRVLRGGAFSYSSRSLRAAYRLVNRPENRIVNVSFRMVWSSSP